MITKKIIFMLVSFFIIIACNDDITSSNTNNNNVDDYSDYKRSDYNGEGERTPASGINPYINRHYSKGHYDRPCIPPRYRCLDDIIVVASKQGVVNLLDNHISNGTVDQFFNSSSYHELYEDIDLVDNPAYLALVSGEATLEKHIVGSNTITSNTICYNIIPANSSTTLSDWDWYYSSTTSSTSTN